MFSESKRRFTLNFDIVRKKKNYEIKETIIKMKISKITKCEYIKIIQNFERKENIWNFSENSENYSRLKLDLWG